MVLSSDFILCFCGFCQKKTNKERNNWHYEWTSLSNFQNVLEECLIFISMWLQMHKICSLSISHNESWNTISGLNSTSVWYNKINALILLTDSNKQIFLISLWSLYSLIIIRFLVTQLKSSFHVTNFQHSLSEQSCWYSNSGVNIISCDVIHGMGKYYLY